MNACLIFILIVQSLYVISTAAYVPKVCTLNKKTGPCRASILSYYYDSRQQKCLRFIYGGCRGNANRFRTLQACEKRCKGTKERKCDRICFMVYAPVCGSDGKTYSNECVMKVAACKSKKDIKKVHDGTCKRKCDSACTLIYSPVCGSDGKTYSNECVLKMAACKAEKDIKKVHDGSCKRKCDSICFMVYAPVCGSDGKTYSNECVMKVAACKAERDIKKVHDGPCKKKCDKPCFRIYSPVCGSDGKTYSNQCMMEVADCKSQKDIKKIHDGPCNVCAMKSDAGPCKALFWRYYYNSSSGKCERFTYGGCLGNKNNFLTIQACQAKCP